MKVHPSQNSSRMQQLISNLFRSIEDEATAISFYSHLLQQANSPLAKSYIQHALNDEKEHLEDFTKLYIQFTGHTPQYHIHPVGNMSYKEGLIAALNAELGAQEFYRKIYMNCTDQHVRDIYYNAMMDEIEHSIRFSTLISLIHD